MIPYGRQEVTQSDIDAVVGVLRSDLLTQGTKVPEFEQRIARHVGAAHGVAANSATSSLHLACLALGVGPGDHVWTSPNSFVASANCALYCGAHVDFVDIDLNDGNLSVGALEQKLLAAAGTDRLPKVVIVVHFAGHVCDMRRIAALARRFGFRIIEDASHAIGSRYLEEWVGCCRYSDVTVFSFHPVKIITTAEGGMAVTNDAALASSMSALRSHGITRDPVKFHDRNEGAWYYEQQALGFNYRMPDVLAALGLSQLGRLESYVERRNSLAGRYEELLRGLPLTALAHSVHCRSAYHLYVVRLEGRAGARRRDVFDFMRTRGIGVNVHYVPIYRQPHFRARGHVSTECPNAEAHYSRSLTLPLYATLSDADQDRVANILGEALMQ